jgi:hypothetical protein
MANEPEKAKQEFEIEEIAKPEETLSAEEAEQAEGGALYYQQIKNIGSILYSCGSSTCGSCKGKLPVE